VVRVQYLVRGQSVLQALQGTKVPWDQQVMLARLVIAERPTALCQLVSLVQQITQGRPDLKELLTLLNPESQHTLREILVRSIQQDEAEKWEQHPHEGTLEQQEQIVLNELKEQLALLFQEERFLC